ncbi:hypothetical protein EW145_g3769 [Phellinidium pouzarii]|uniref:Uncharacterized protein n=1 Tax=Phellinidium pouzarii TaxID=167371 RepID=A0A4S4L6E3_9AGAM|nr:hypothetical protein EW145_g3769 [Phellinidium pouzarii]
MADATSGSQAGQVSHADTDTYSFDDNTNFMEVDDDPPVMLSEPDVPVLSATGRPSRTRRLPARYRDEIPNEPIRPADEPAIEASEPDTRGIDGIALRLSVFRSERNKYGLTRIYKQVDAPFDLRPKSTAEPEEAREIDIIDADFAHTMLFKHKVRIDSSLYAPHPNLASFKVNQWFWLKQSQTQKNLNELQKIIVDYVNPGDLAFVNFEKINKKLGDSSLDNYFLSDDGWRLAALQIPIPLGHLHADAPNEVHLPINDFYYRPLTGIIRSVFQSKAESKNFCYEPYELRYKPLMGEPEMAVYGELYWSKKFREAHEEIQRLPQVSPDDNLPRAVVALQFWSDGMAATNFGNAKCYDIDIFSF